MYAIILNGRSLGQATGLVLDSKMKVNEVFYSEYDPSKGMTVHWRREIPETGIQLSGCRNGSRFVLSPIDGKRTHHGRGNLTALFAKRGYQIIVGEMESYYGESSIPSQRLTQALVSANGK